MLINTKSSVIKVAIVTAVSSTIEKLLLAQVKSAQQAGFEVHAICTQDPHFEKLKEDGLKMHPVTIKRKISPFSDLVALWRMFLYLRKERIDIVHTHTPKVSLLGQLAAKMAGVPVIINTVHGFYFHDNMNSLAKRFYVLMEKIAAKCSDYILSQNPEDIETAIKLGICPKEKIGYLGNGIDLNKFNPDNFDYEFRKKKREEIGIPEDAIVISIIGRLVREKGYLELFQAVRELIQKHHNLWLMIIGPEEPEKSDKISIDTFKNYGIESCTKYLGSRDDIPELLSICDIYTLPSWREGFPRSAIEAAAMGLPIVTTDIRGCRQVVDNRKNGLLVPVRNVHELRDALWKFIENPEMRKRYGSAGFKKAQKEFNEEHVCQKVLEIYQYFLSKKPYKGCK